MFLPRALNLCACSAEEREGLADVISIHDHLTNQILLSRSGKHTSQRARYALHIRCIYALCVSAGHVQGVVGTRRPRAHASLERQEAWTLEVGLHEPKARTALCH